MTRDVDTVVAEVRLTVEIRRPLADRLTLRLRDLIRSIEGADGLGASPPFDVETADLGTLIARTFDRQCAPLAELYELVGEDEDPDDQYWTFGKAVLLHNDGQDTP